MANLGSSQHYAGACVGLVVKGGCCLPSFFKYGPKNETSISILLVGLAMMGRYGPDAQAWRVS